MSEPTSPEEIEFHGEEQRLIDIFRYYPEPVTFSIPSGGAPSLRVRLKRVLKNFISNPLWTSSLDRDLAWKIYTAYTFVADSKTSLYVGFPRRMRLSPSEQLRPQAELPVIRTENPEILRALFLLKNHDHIPLPVKIETALPIYDLKEPYYNVEIADSIHENNYTII